MQMDPVVRRIRILIDFFILALTSIGLTAIPSNPRSAPALGQKALVDNATKKVFIVPLCLE